MLGLRVAWKRVLSKGAQVIIQHQGLEYEGTVVDIRVEASTERDNAVTILDSSGNVSTIPLGQDTVIQYSKKVYELNFGKIKKQEDSVEQVDSKPKKVESKG